jgi:hypothetical protein
MQQNKINFRALWRWDKHCRNAVKIGKSGVYELRLSKNKKEAVTRWNCGG